jgi:hypothetical protein
MGGLLAHPADHGQQERHQYGDNGDDDQELEEGKRDILVG